MAKGRELLLTVALTAVLALGAPGVLLLQQPSVEAEHLSVSKLQGMGFEGKGTWSSNPHTCNSSTVLKVCWQLERLLCRGMNLLIWAVLMGVGEIS